MFLEKIIEVKREDVEKRKRRLSQRDLEEGMTFLPRPRDFGNAVPRDGRMGLIAEIKRASPSAGAIAEDVSITRLAMEFEKGGASAVSVVTDTPFFKGDLYSLMEIKAATTLPLLQKDFILDPFQIYEGRVSGADGILLIAAILEAEQLRDFADLALSLHMIPLVEIHSEDDLEKVSDISLPIIGINNRNLKTFEVDIMTTLRLRREIPPHVRVISESGIKTPDDMRILKDAAVSGVLVGESLMRSKNPAAKIRELLA
jgi:indole-3-glycerol phosphate synthase